MVMNRTININTTNHIQMKAIVVMSTQPEDNKILNTDRSDLPTFLLFVTVFSEMLKSPLSIIAYQPTFFFIYLAFINGTQLAVLSCVTTFLMCMMLIAASRLFYLDHKGTLESHVIERCKHDKLLTWLKKRFSS